MEAGVAQGLCHSRRTHKKAKAAVRRLWHWQEGQQMPITASKQAND
jgi:hypothetical protein